MRSRPSRSAARVVGRGIVYGTLWGVGVSASEALVLPFGPLAAAPVDAMMGRILMNWCIQGACVACGVLFVEPRLDRWWKVALAVVVAAVGVAALNGGLWIAAQRFVGLRDLREVLGEAGGSVSTFVYVFWVTLMHGGLFIVACVLTSRAERARNVLGEAQIARDRTESLLDKLEIEALYGEVEPAFLVRAMRAVRDRSAFDAAGAEQLLDALVAFLRLAMPGVRSGGSTLAVELQLAASYAALQRLIDPRRDLWRIDADPALPALPFPPLLLLPLLDALTLPGGVGPLTLKASLHRESQRVTLAVVTPPGAAPAVEVPAALKYRLRVALQATLGDAWQITDRASGTTLPDTMAVVLRIDARPPAPAAPVQALEPHVSPVCETATVLHELRAASILNPGAFR